MSHFAKIDSDNIVVNVIVAEQDFINSGVVGDSFNWIQTSYNDNFRKNYAAIGDTYDSVRNAFIAPKPFNAWVLDEETCRWEAPFEQPVDLGPHVWSDDTNGWIPSS